jgi:S1-C subfamily serine protease
VLEGLTIQPLDHPLRDRLHVPGNLNGLVITRIDPNSATAQIGLRAGDVIVEVNRQPVPTLDAFRNATRDSTHGVLLLIYRDGMMIYMSLSR